MAGGTRSAITGTGTTWRRIPLTGRRAVDRVDPAGAADRLGVETAQHLGYDKYGPVRRRPGVVLRRARAPAPAGRPTAIPLHNSPRTLTPMKNAGVPVSEVGTPSRWRVLGCFDEVRMSAGPMVQITRPPRHRPVASSNRLLSDGRGWRGNKFCKVEAIGVLMVAKRTAARSGPTPSIRPGIIGPDDIHTASPGTPQGSGLA
jgi:hypothetical protein